MSNEVFWSAVETDAGRQLLESEILLALGDSAAIPNHQALGITIDFTGRGADTAEMREDDINGSQPMTTIAEGGSWTNSAVNTDRYDLGVSHYFRQHTISDWTEMLDGEGQFSPARFAASYVKSEAVTWAAMLATTIATAAAAGPTMSGQPNLEDLVEARYVLQAAYADDGPIMGVFHPYQIRSLKLDAGFDQTLNFAVMNDPEVKAIAKATGSAYVGRYDGIDMFQSWRVTTSGGKYVGGLFTRGGIAKGIGSFQGSGGYPRSVQLGRIRFSEERDPTGPRRALRGETALGSALFQDERIVKFQSPTA